MRSRRVLVVRWGSRGGATTSHRAFCVREAFVSSASVHKYSVVKRGGGTPAAACGKAIWGVSHACGKAVWRGESGGGERGGRGVGEEGERVAT